MSDVSQIHRLHTPILEAIVNADCYCEPGDPTCEDWVNKDARWKAIHESVMAVVLKADEREQSNLVDHARRELELVGEDPDAIAGICDVVYAFSQMGHSGYSAMYFTAVLNQLLQFNNLTPLTDNPEEWYFHGSDAWPPAGIWQNKRNGEAFSNDGGKTYRLNSDTSVLRIANDHTKVRRPDPNNPEDIQKPETD